VRGFIDLRLTANVVTRHDKPYRAVALCAANAAGNEVTGTANGGVENFIAAEGYNIHVLDYHNGSLKHVFVGKRNRISRREAVELQITSKSSLLY
jgi:hypothetical protein